MRGGRPERSLGEILKRLGLFTLLFLGLSAVGTYAVYRQVAGRMLAWDPALLSAPLLVSVLLLLLAYFASDALRLHFTLRALGHDLPLRSIARLVFINIFFSHVTPMATGGGVAQIWYLRRRGVDLGTATAATTIRTVLAIVFIFSSAPVFLLSLERLQGALGRVPLEASLAVMVGLYATFFAVVLFRPRWLAWLLVGGVSILRAVRLIGRDRARRWRFAVKRELLRFAGAFGRYASGPRSDVALSVAFTALFLLSLFSFPAILLWGLGYDVSYLTVLGLLVATTFVMYFAPTPGASGVAEGFFGLVFAGIVAAGHLVLVTVAWRFLTVYLGMFVGMLVTMHETMTSGESPP